MRGGGKVNQGPVGLLNASDKLRLESFGIRCSIWIHVIASERRHWQCDKNLREKGVNKGGEEEEKHETKKSMYCAKVNVITAGRTACR